MTICNPDCLSYSSLGVLLTMPCFVGNYNLPSTSGEKQLDTLGCKLVTSFNGNESRGLPTIMATIVLMNPETGKLEAILEGTEITKWRTAAASLVATKYLYFDRPSVSAAQGYDRILSIVGCGVQGEIHAIAFASYFGQVKEIRLYNRTIAKRDLLFDKLNSLRSTFKNPNLTITKADTPFACAQDADIVVIATNSSVPLIKKEDLKSDVHINGSFDHIIIVIRKLNHIVPFSFSSNWSRDEPPLGTGHGHLRQQ